MNKFYKKLKLNFIIKNKKCNNIKMPRRKIILPPLITDSIVSLKVSYGLCKWCSTVQQSVNIGRGYYCPHYHEGTPTFKASVLVSKEDFLK